MNKTSETLVRIGPQSFGKDWLEAVMLQKNGPPAAPEIQPEPVTLPQAAPVSSDKPISRSHLDTVPAGYCPTCWVRWSRALRTGNCICTGDVQLGSRKFKPAL